MARMENQGFLFIPDISGFTRFVTQTEIEHSRLIIQELLELLINANQLGLEVSEIEGDAILFFRFGAPPSLEDIYRQVEKMFSVFHRSLVVYDHHKYCQCRACVSAIELSLKIITHYGEFASYSVKNFNKLIGKDVIVAHQLLKNEIEQHEYWLVTKDLLQDNQLAGFEQWMRWNRSVKKTEIGEIVFHYTQLSPLKEEITLEPLSDPGINDKIKMFSVSREYDVELVPLFRAVGDFSYRNRWQEGVKSVEGISHFLPRVGMRCSCVTDKGTTIIYANSYYFRSDRIEFSETDENRKTATFYTVEKIEDHKTRLTIDLYMQKKLIPRITFRIAGKGKAMDAFQRSLQRLDALVKEIAPEILRSSKPQ